MKEVLRHCWRGVSQLLGGGDIVFHSFLFEYFVQFINHYRYIWGAT